MTEYRTLLSNFVKKSQINGLLKNDGTVDTTSYVSTSDTQGLLKNDGTVDTTSYLSIHQDITDKEDKSNKVTSISSSSTDTQYPSAKLLYDTTNQLENSIVDMVYPIGSIYMSVNSTSPQTLFGGTWEQIKDTFLLATGDTYANGSTGGSATVTLTSAQSGLKAHGHGMDHNHNHRHNLNKDFSTGSGGSTSAYITSSNRKTSTQYTGYDSTASSKKTTDNNTASNASEAHENMPPYLTVYMWKRTA